MMPRGASRGRAGWRAAFSACLEVLLHARRGVRVAVVQQAVHDGGGQRQRLARRGQLLRRCQVPPVQACKGRQAGRGGSGQLLLRASSLQSAEGWEQHGAGQAGQRVGTGCRSSAGQVLRWAWASSGTRRARVRGIP